MALVNDLRMVITKRDKTVTGFNVGINDGTDAGQTIFHCHIHLIPRRNGDVLDPRGGLRNIIPSRGSY
jgi:diadenosine tetraphosphate (Ap4A) HIT family hydrolase